MSKVQNVIKTYKNPSNAKFKTTKLNLETVKNNNKQLKQSLNKDYLDFSTEENGYITKKDSLGNILEVFKIKYIR